LAVIGVWFITVLGLLLFIPPLSQRGVFPELLAVQKSIQLSGKVHVATAIVGKSWGTSSGKKWESNYFGQMQFGKNGQAITRVQQERLQR
jgi:hypothetical protein